MNIPAYSLLIACLLPIVAAGLQKWGARDYDNHNPRQWSQHMSEPRRQRALAAQANSWEALIVFAAALLFALQAELESQTRDLLCVSFIVSRLLYIGAYYFDKALLRSLVWFVGFGSALAMIGLSAR
ncbi:MAG: hypothetical protein EBT36_01805 [Betaproteobacteria bacterium]|jgi:uncharacterized MAPEG superfamily protein|nr:MAPEG family protein [Pseudomonadota bacterium]NBO03021.1 hypothetical protein [Betaproteobacteria bacterium]NBO95286.1 hypothetical protein [Betaproteobacteria bacterium]NBP34132.1 hypothetical protein [Betaproteobacteria bacterium]NBP38220.1 hypothetical protein [Betaproteobacteria bacterium]